MINIKLIVLVVFFFPANLQYYIGGKVLKISRKIVRYIEIVFDSND